MGVFTFVCRSSGGEWTAKQLSGDLEASASSTFDLQRKLVHAAAAADSSGGVQSSFSFVTPKSAVFQDRGYSTILVEKNRSTFENGIRSYQIFSLTVPSITEL